MTEPTPEPMTIADWLIVNMLCQFSNQFPGPNAWMCRRAWITLHCGLPFDTDQEITTHASWLNKSENADARKKLADCIEWLRTAAAKPPLWELPDNAFDPTDRPDGINVRTWLPGDNDSDPNHVKATIVYDIRKWDGRPFPGRCDHTYNDGQQCGNQAASSYGYWDGGAPGAGTFQQTGRCTLHIKGISA